MINKLFVSSLILLGLFTIFCSVHSCGNGVARPLKFVNPPSESALWVSDFVLWERTPIRVRVDGSMWEMLTKDVERATNSWNDAIGCRVFEPSWESEAEVVVHMSPQPEDTNWVGSHIYVHRHDKRGRNYWGSDLQIHVLFLADQAFRDNVMSHELGHALGLADLPSNSDLLMYKNISKGMKIHEEALSTLKIMYCAEE